MSWYKNNNQVFFASKQFLKLRKIILYEHSWWLNCSSICTDAKKRPNYVYFWKTTGSKWLTYFPICGVWSCCPFKFSSTEALQRYKVNWSRYRPCVAQRVGRCIALLFHYRGTRRRWVVSNTPRPHFTPGKDPVPIVQGAGWTPGPVWTGGKSRPHRDSIPTDALQCIKIPLETLI